MREITADDVDEIGLGATLLGSGGGGDIGFATLMARHALERHGAVPLVAATDLDPEACVLPIAYGGAPGVAVEKLPSGTEIGTAIDALERFMGIRCAALMMVEVGGGNTLMPIGVAAERGLPFVDADTMRRAFPEAQMTLFAAAGLSATPMAIGDQHGNAVVVETVDNRATDAIGRAAIAAMGYVGGIAAYLVRARQVVEHAAPGSVTYCAEVGRCIQRIQQGGGADVGELLDLTEGTMLFSGKVIDVDRGTSGGFTKAVVTLQGLHDESRVMRVDAQNENLVAVEDGEVRAVTPDLICFVDSETATPVTVETVQFGMRLHVLALPCAERWKTEAGMRLVGPRAFGYNFDYVEFAR